MNPLYRDDDKEFDDSESNDGDDVFIGIENQDDFKGYKDRYDVSLKNSGILFWLNRLGVIQKLRGHNLTLFWPPIYLCGLLYVLNVEKMAKFRPLTHLLLSMWFFNGPQLIHD